MESKKKFLCPITTSCRLIMLYFCPVGTKIRIVDHTIQLVHDTYYERLFNRKIYGDSRNDLCVLFPVMIRFIELYLIGREPDDTKYHNSIVQFTRYLIMGIDKLASTYEFDNVVFVLKYFANLLRAGIDGTYNREMLPPHLLKPLDNNLLDISKVKNLWDDKTIIELTELFIRCFNAYDEADTKKMKVYSAAISEMLNSKDIEFKEIITHTTSA